MSDGRPLRSSSEGDVGPTWRQPVAGRLGKLGKAAIAVGAVGAVAATWELTRRRDASALEADPGSEVLDAPLPGTPRTVVGADGTRLAAQVAGPDDAPATVVLVHGWGMGRRYWFHQLRDLATDLRVVAYDHRGHGASQVAWDDDHSLEALARDLDAVVAQLVPDDDRPLVLVGHSMGGMTIMAAAAEHLSVVDRAGGVVLMDTGAGDLAANVFAGLGVVEVAAKAVGVRALRSRFPVPRRTTPISSRVVRYAAHGRGASPAAVALTEQLFLDCPADVRAAFGASLSTLDLVDALAELKVATTVVCGSLDRLTPPRMSRRLVEELPDARLVTLEGAGHQTAAERADETTALIREQVDRAAAARR
ncbi:alpha/beta hydrolase [Nitriliruptoraceae bacterium ZYF776]|nr:alpha/beta hydrolase [Profundirhabdus halotolerans]